jgi:F-type H+-transporting ATPase subunit delta
MASVDERSLALGRVYARAILELGEAQGESASLLDEINGLAQLLDGDPELAHFFSSPLIEPEVREPVIEKVFRGRASDLLVDTLQIVNRKGRLGVLRAIAEAYRQEYRDLHGLVDARVRTAVPLSEELRARLHEAVARFTGRQPSLIEKVDPALIGGMIVEVAGRKIDSSVAYRLRQMGAALDRRASQEIQRGNASFVE